MKPSKSYRYLGLFPGIVLLVMLMSSCAQWSVFNTQPTGETAFGKDHQPNIVIILTDDQRYDTMDFMPETKALIFDRGITFSKAYVTTPLCCPSRASVLTGMYAHSNQVLSNQHKLNQTTFVERLHEAGYYTGMVGKYLNSWDGTPRPEFDFWVGSTRKGYVNPSLNVNGLWQMVEGYQTDIFGQYALQFLDQAAQQDKPWLLYYSVRAPHNPATPAPEYKNLYSDLPPFRPPSFNEQDISDKPFDGKTALLTPELIEANDSFRLKQLRTLKSVDDTVSDIVGMLDDRGMLEDTAIFFLSDNGMLWGEHRLSKSKTFPYEPSIRTPFAFYFPRLATPPRVIDGLVANIDIAPTIYELAGIPQPPEVEGRSLIPLIRGQRAWRDSLIIESWGFTDLSPDDTEEDLGTGKYVRPYMAIHTGQYVLVQYGGGASELYDLEKDPDELQNEIDNPDYTRIVQDLNVQYETLRAPYLAELAKLMDSLTPTSSP